MNKDLLELANSAVRTALASGANACSARVSNDRSVEISYRERKPETIKEAATRGLALRFYVNGRYSAQSTSDLRPDALKRFNALIPDVCLFICRKFGHSFVHIAMRCNLMASAQNFFQAFRVVIACPARRKECCLNI